MQTENALFLIDEIDKLQRGYQGDPASALLELLDPEQNKGFLDHYLDVPVDFSRVLFICTANTVSSIPDALLDRMEVMQVSGYVMEEKMTIATVRGAACRAHALPPVLVGGALSHRRHRGRRAQRYLVPKIQRESGVTGARGAIEPAALEQLIRGYCRESGVRSLQQYIERIYRKIALRMVSGGTQNPTDTVVVTPDNLREYAGLPRYESDRLYDTTPPGVATGLAWTPLGTAAWPVARASRRTRCAACLHAVLVQAALCSSSRPLRCNSARAKAHTRAQS